MLGCLWDDLVGEAAQVLDAEDVDVPKAWCGP